MVSRLVLVILLASSVSVGGCASGRAPSGAGADVSIAVAPPPPPPVTASHSSFGEPHHIPAVLAGPQAVADTDPPYLLDSGDRLRIFVYGQPNLSRLYTVDHAGTISVPLIGTVKARGLKTVELEARLRGRLGTRYVKDPQVTVDIAQTRPFYILGEVRNAGQFPYVSGMTVQSAIATAGGYSERANERKVHITRRINGYVERMTVPPDYVVQPGDTIHVPERYF
jgi:polysaccharide export outer membrane protein